MTFLCCRSLQSCLTLCNPIDGLPSGSPVPGILQARTLEWVTISFSKAWKWKWSRSVATPWTAAHQALPSMDFPGKTFLCTVKQIRNKYTHKPYRMYPFNVSQWNASVHLSWHIFQPTISYNKIFMLQSQKSNSTFLRKRYVRNLEI